VKRKFVFVAAFFVITVCMNPAWADIDQQCLKQCVAQNNASGGCLQQCTYGESASSTQKSSTFQGPTPSSSHRVLNTPIPLDDRIVLQPKHAASTSGKDYTCFTQCLHSGKAYQLCETHCAKPECPSGAVLCSSLVGTANTNTKVPAAAAH
jgi:hypothetical protein